MSIFVPIIISNPENVDFMTMRLFSPKKDYIAGFRPRFLKNMGCPKQTRSNLKLKISKCTILRKCGVLIYMNCT